MRGWFVLLAMLSGCGLGGGDFRCDFAEATSASYRCRDYTYRQPVSTGPLESDCTGEGGTWSSDALCPHEGAVAGCRVSAGTVDITFWYYSPVERSYVDMNCGSEVGGFIVEP